MSFNASALIVPAGIVTGTALACAAAEPWVGYRSVGLLFLLAVVAVGYLRGVGTTIAAASVSALLWNYFFIPPKLTFHISETSDLLLVGSYFVVGGVLGILTSRLRGRTAALLRRQSELSQLIALGHALQTRVDRSEVVQDAASFLERVTGARAVFYFPIGSDAEKVSAETRLDGTLPPAGADPAIAAACLSRRERLGPGSGTMEGIKDRYFPILSADGKGIGVLCLEAAPTPAIAAPTLASAGEEVPQEGHIDWLEAAIANVALALDRAARQSGLEQLRVQRESDALHRMILEAMSHELKTPIALVRGSCSALLAAGDGMARADRMVLLETAEAGALRLDRLTTNLLHSLRLDSGAVRPKLEPMQLADVLHGACEKVRYELGGRSLEIDVSESLWVIADAALIEQAVINILHNAAIHSSAGGLIQIAARKAAGKVVMSIDDAGPGIDEALLGRLFKRFERGEGAVAGGTGLGLAVAKGFMLAQGGDLEAIGKGTLGGAQFRLILNWVATPQVMDDE